MSAELEVKVDGLRVVSMALARLSTPAGRRQALEVIGATVESQTRRRLSREKRDPKGRPWKPWSRDYAARRTGSGGILDLRGSLIDSIRYDVAGEDGVEVGSSLAYARRHQLGDEGGKPMPQREFIGLSSANEREVSEVIGDWLMEGWR
ncbi:MAG: phage virion morphogenesis protein [Acidimicrobiia bacterium]|nr:MAG: phage virion morphogenesis protein [Acidimicrobiia bacterium]